jgi:hypothetical protein
MNTAGMKLIAVLVIAAFFVVSCGLPPAGTALTPEERASAQKSCIAQYTAGGAILGSIAGALIGGRGGWGTGAAIGAAAGGAIAFMIAWGKCMEYFSDLKSFPVAGAAETAQRVGYTAAQGNVTKIESFEVTPTETAPGKSIKTSGSYYVLAPSGAKEVKVTETRIYYYLKDNQWTELGSVPSEITAEPGTRRLDGRFDLPGASEMDEGRYRIATRIEANGVQDTATKEIIVKKGLAGIPQITVVASR